MEAGLVDAWQHLLAVVMVVGGFELGGWDVAAGAVGLELIGAAMGKAVAEPSAPSLPEEYDLDEEEPGDEDVVESAA